MKNPWLLAMMAVLAVTLSCSLPLQQTSWTHITSVTVTPPSGEKDFSLEVKYNYTWDREQPNAEIYCMYTSPSGSAIPIGTIVPAGLDRDREAFSKTAKLAFTVKPKDGKIEPGVYLAGCATEHDGSLMTATFTVTASATPTPTPSDEPAAIPIQTPSVEAASTATETVTPTPAPVSMRIIFDFARTESNRPGAGGELSRVTNLCMPEVSLDSLGNLSGQCEKLHIAALLMDESITVHVTGRVDATGNFSFSYEVSEIGTPSGTWRISYVGQGKLTLGGQASGRAIFSFSCNSGADNLLWCGKQTSEAFSGAIPWSFAPSK